MIIRAVAILAAFAAAASAQDLRGVVSDAASKRPIAGAVIQLLGASGNEVSRALSNERGEYRLLLSGEAGKVRVLRMGFRPFEKEVPALASGTAKLDVTMRVLATMLEAVAVMDQPGCSRRADRAQALALWEQAKTGLLASVVGRDVQAGSMRVLLYNRFLTTVGNRITQQTVRIHDGEAAASFRASKSAGDFVAQGFVAAQPAGNMYHAPDADVLLDENFPHGYCFGLAPRERARATQVGLSFAPMQRNRRITAVDGTLWIDTAARRLVDLAYRYQVDDASVMRLNPGGHIEFREMENGVVLIDRWYIRMVGAGPQVEGPIHISRETELFDATISNIVRQQHVSEGGGELARATWPGEVTWRGSLGTLRAMIVSKGGDPIAGARVKLSSTDYAGVADSTGLVTIEDLLPGPYTVEIDDSTLSSIGVPLETKTSFTAARDRQSDLRITALSADDYVRKLCENDQVYDRNSVKLIARVVGPDGNPVSRASIESDYFTGTTSSDGIFVMCAGLKPNVRIPLRVSSSLGAADAKLELGHKVNAIKVVIAVPPKP